MSIVNMSERANFSCDMQNKDKESHTTEISSRITRIRDFNLCKHCLNQIE